MNGDKRRAARRTLLFVSRLAVPVLLTAGIAGSRPTQSRDSFFEGEFHLVRVAYATSRRANSRGYNTPMWAVDWPHAELNFVPALGRLTKVSVDSEDAAIDDRLHLKLTDEKIFKYPFLFLQQPGAGYWNPTDQEAAQLREYLARGGFLLVDDFHGNNEFAVFQAAISRVLPDRQIVDIPDDDPLMHMFFDLGDRLQIPGDRHLRGRRGGQVVVRMAGPPRWMGIYDDENRLMVGINFNIDMGDAWEHADDPNYPAPMTGQAYRLGINYVIYAMTH